MIRIHRSLAVCLLLALGYFAASGCTVKPIPPPDISPQQLQSAWDYFQTTFSSLCPARDFFARGSVNYVSGDRGSRLLFSFWGHTHFPVRMDLQAGVGTMLAHWREDEQGWIGYHPGSKEAFVSSDSRSGAATLGLVMPLRLDALAQILTGCWGQVVPYEYAAARFTKHQFEYFLEHDAKTTVLTLSMDGYPMSLRKDGPDGWSVVIEEWFEDRYPPSPKRLRLVQGQNVAVVRLLQLDLTAASWQKSDLLLELPAGTMLRGLEPRQ